MKIKFRSALTLIPFSVIFLLGCFSSSNSDSSSHVGDIGKTKATFVPTPMIAKFTDDYVVPYHGGGEFLSIRKGQEFIVSDYQEGNGFNVISLYMILDGTPLPFQVRLHDSLPGIYTTSSPLEKSSKVYGAFMKVTAYSDQDLTTIACEIPQGQVSTLENFNVKFVNTGAQEVVYKIANVKFEACSGVNEIFTSTTTVTLPNQTKTQALNIAKYLTEDLP